MVWFARPASALEPMLDRTITPPRVSEFESKNLSNASGERVLPLKGEVSVNGEFTNEECLLPGGFSTKSNMSVEDCIGLAEKGIYLVPKIEPHRYTYKYGNLGLFPDHETTLETVFGELTIPKNTLVYLIHKEDSLAIYDLSKDGFRDAKLVTHEKTISLNPGMECIVADSHYKKPQELPQLSTAISFRAYKRAALEKAHECCFATRFSITSAFEIMQPLNQLKNSKIKREHKAFMQALKTCAILLDMDPAFDNFPNTSLDDITIVYNQQKEN